MTLAGPSCNAKADPRVSTGSGCAKKMTRACPACAETISAISTSCKYCGEGMAPAKEAAPARPEPGIVFIEEKKQRSCCAGRTMFWLMVGLLAAFCGYSAIKTRVHVQKTTPVKQEIQKQLPDKSF